MKKLFTLSFLAAAFVLASGEAKAQDPKASATTSTFNLSVDLTASVVSINLAGTPNVQFVYADAADYVGAKTVKKEGHFTVVSNRAYDVKMTAAAAFSTVDDKTLPLDVVTATAVKTASTGGGSPTATLATGEGSTLVSGGTATVGSTYDVDFKIENPESLFNYQGATYNTDVTYTVTQI